MIKEGKFGVSEAVCLVTITVSAKIFFTSPAVLLTHVGTAIWYETLVSAAAALVGFAFIYLLLKRFPNKDLAEIFDLSMGRAAGLLFSLGFILLLFSGSSLVIREIADGLRAYTFMETSTGLLVGTIAAAAAAAAYLGLESIARVSRLASWFLLAGYVLLLVLPVKEYHFYNVFPILGYGIDRTLLVGIQRSSVYAEVAVLGVFAAALQGVKHIKRAGIVSLVLSAVIIALGLLAELLMFSYTTGQENAAPLYALARVIKFGNFLTRLDALFLLLWSVATLITVSVLFYASVSMFCKAFRLPDKRPVIVPMTLILFALAMAPRDFSTIVYGFIEGLRRYSWAVYFGLPAIALLTAAVRKKKGGWSLA